MRQPIIKFVKKASQWCKTSWGKDGKQKQEWFAIEDLARENK